MKKLGTSIRPGAILLTRLTGSGKSSVDDIYSIMCAGVSLVITPLLSLGADQAEKIWRNASLDGGPVHAYHLAGGCVAVSTSAENSSRTHSLASISWYQHYHLPLLVSTSHLQQPTVVAYDWLELISKWLLIMLCIDKVHLFVHFGLAFWQDQFVQLQSVLLKKVQVKASPSAKPSQFYTSVPVLLLMTATCNQMMVR
jgi:superfamily II DNA helicase RecQ